MPIKITYSKDGFLEYYECEIEIKSLKADGFWAKNKDIKDSLFFPVNNVEVVVQEVKNKGVIYKGIGWEDGEEPKMKKGSNYILVLKRI